MGIERRIDLREECKGVGQGRERGKKDKAVSYTHLTLPTTGDV